MSWTWASPVDGTLLDEVGGQLVSLDGKQRFDRVGETWWLLPPDERAELEAWSTAYGAIRTAEGRIALDDYYYRALPWRDTTGRFGEQWEQRARSFDRLLADLDAMTPGCVVDVGAGNGWASARLSERGWAALALDVNVDVADGLGAVARHGVAVETARASLERLPLAGAQADVVVFNASLHYATDPAAAVAEAIRVLRPSGRCYVIDSPVYRSPAAGAAMVSEQQAALARYGQVPQLRGPGYLLRSHVREWSRGGGATWSDLSPRKDPLRATLGRWRAGREIAQLSFLVARKEAS